MKIKYYKTNLGLLVTQEGYSTLTSKRINGETPQPTFHSDWFTLENCTEITSVQQKGMSTSENPRWELIDPSLESEKLPLVLSCEEVEETEDEDDYLFYWNVRPAIQKLYTRCLDRVEGVWEEQEFESVCLSEIEIEHPKDPVKMNYKVIGKSHTHRDQVSELPPLVGDLWGVDCSDIAKALVPSVFWHEQPCFLSSELTYALVRNHILENIDGRYARVTSNYSFCFTVKRLVSKKPLIIKTEQKKFNGKSYAKPRFTSRTETHEEEEIFEMTNSKDKYGKYTVINGFKGENLADLKMQIDTYLEELMEVINAPIKQCEHCNGVGAKVVKHGTN